MRIGIDIGGTKIAGLALADDGRELDRRRIAAPRGNYDDSIRAVVDLISAIETAVNDRGTIGVGIPGAISPATGLIKNANSTWLNGRRLADDLSHALGRPVRLANDANCFALSEATGGAARGAAVVFGVIIGTGTGGGLVVDGRIVAGANAIGGEWGHNPLPASGVARPPSRSDRDASGRFCRRRSPRHSRAATTHVRSHIVALAGAGARAGLSRRYERRTRAIASVINVVDRTAIVLGGGLSEHRASGPRAGTVGAHVAPDRSTRNWWAEAHGAQRRARRGVAVAMQATPGPAR